MLEISLAELEKVRDDLKKVINQTPLQFSQTFSNWTETRVFLKPECLQKIGSFKIRGAYNMLKNLSQDEKTRGVVTCSAGNWAQGVAYSANLLKIHSTIVMPEVVVQSKVDATKGYGGDVLLYGKNSKELVEKARQLSEEKGWTYIPAWDNLDMMKGHASIGLEIFEENPDTDVIIVPIGGGGLISGISLAAKRIKPSVRIIGVQPTGANAMFRSLQEGRVVEIEKVETIADGLAVKRPGERTFEIIRENVEKIVLVSDEEIKRAIVLLLERAKLLVEPAGAAPLAALLSGHVKGMGKNIVIVLSGGNIDFALLKTIL